MAWWNDYIKMMKINGKKSVSSENKTPIKQQLEVHVQRKLPAILPQRKTQHHRARLPMGVAFHSFIHLLFIAKFYKYEIKCK